MTGQEGHLLQGVKEGTALSGRTEASESYTDS